jgi:hypothetical protein
VESARYGLEQTLEPYFKEMVINDVAGMVAIDQILVEQDVKGGLDTTGTE